jgi:hypothetical protein
MSALEVPTVIALTGIKVYVFGWLPIAYLFDLPFWF